eukprot:4036037-Prymnesium_polylepis.1
MCARGGGCAAATCAPCEPLGPDGRGTRVERARRGACCAPWSDGLRCRARKREGGRKFER